MQVIFAGKAHPADRPGQGVIQDIFGRSRSPKLRGRVFILEDYDIRIARFLVQGVDVWLNNPRRPLEASGTSGMKAAANGVVNVSVLDGWWDEGWTGDNGWAIGGRETNPDEGAQDWADSQDLYRILETELIPAYYERGADGVPQRWMQLMRNSIASTIWRFSTTRMLHEYVERLYLPAAAADAEVPGDGRSRGSRALTRISKGGHGGTPHLARPRHPQPPAGRQLRLGVRRGVRAGLPADGRGPRAPPGRPALAALHGPAARVAGGRATRLPRAAARAGRPRPDRDPGRRPVRARARLAARAGPVDQLTRMAEVVEGIAGRRPLGAWLAERVWEPDLPTALVGAGYRWTILDDQHFRAASIPEANLWGAYTTEDQGRLLTVFGTEQGLRYRIPFGDVEDVIGYLRDHATEAGDRVGMMGDDGEKFGAWPTTYEHCWGSRRWVERFFEALEASRDWLTTVTPSEWLEREPPIGRVYVPTSSYAEMGEWSLPADETVVFTPLLHRAVADHRPEARWLRGGFWRNFQVKYREINDLHKQMLRTSAKVAAMPMGPSKTRAIDHLHRGQSNDCYWHGLFGGIYISHMRLATYEHLIAAEDAADHALGTQRQAELVDLDLDGLPEVLVSDEGQVVAVKPGEGGGIGSWDIRAARHALAAALRRRPEAYHETLRAHEAAGATTPPEVEGEGHADVDDQGDVGGAPASIHDLVMVKEAGLSARLFYDDHELRSGLVRFLAPDTTPEAFATAAATELGDLRDGEFAVDHLAPGQVSLSRHGAVAGQPVTVGKTIRLLGDRLRSGARHRPRAAPPGGRGHRREVRPRAVGPPPGWRRQPVGVVRRRRRPIGPRRERPGRGRRRDRLRQRLGGRRGAGHGRAGGRRVVEPDRDRLELGVRVRARLPGQQPAVLVAAAARPGRGPPVLGAPGGQRRARPRSRGGAGARVSHVPGDRL